MCTLWVLVIARFPKTMEQYPCQAMDMHASANFLRRNTLTDFQALPNSCGTESAAIQIGAAIFEFYFSGFDIKILF